MVGSGQNFADLHDVDNTYDWGTATGSWIAALNAASFAGFSNWRVPTQNELLAIVDATSSPTIDPIFGRTAAQFSWSVSTLDILPTDALGVLFNNGSALIVGKTSAAKVRAVRSGLY